jgi:heat shock protein HslJ
VAEAAAASYFGIYDEPVTLASGTYEGPPLVAGGASRPRVELIEDLTISGDLDRDGNDETVVLLSESSGGSGTFTYLAALARRGSGVENVATVGLGDRVQIREWHLEDDAVVVSLVESGPEDAACCPSRLVTRRWILDGDSLQEGPMVSDGVLSTGVLEGVEWRLVGFGLDERLPAEPKATLLIHGDKVGGTSGCNRFKGSLSTGNMPGDIHFGPLAGTMMACPGAAMDLEQRFLGAMGSVSRFSFHLGRLALTSVAEDGTVSVLLFEPGALATAPDQG